ncbi:MAG: hypothetical protein WAL64_01390 [Candidatus Dormiibacterota bacterium]
MSTAHEECPFAPSKTVKRNIHFFRADAGETDEKTPVQVDIALGLTALDGLSFGERYHSSTEAEVLCGWVDQVSGPSRVRLAKIRRDDLPLSENDGELTPLPIGETSGLYEPIHATFFPNNIVGVVYNFYGPRVGWLPVYLRSVAPDADCPPFTLHPLLKQDTADQLDKMKDVRVLNLEINASYASIVAQADKSLGDALEAAALASEAQVVHLILRPEPWKRNLLRRSLIEAVRSLARRGDLRENTRTFTVAGQAESDGSNMAIDVLKDRFVAQEIIVRLSARSRAVDDSDAYRAIQDAYEALRSDLESAPSVRTG